MITKKSRLQLATALCGAFIFGDAVFANAATVVFPQQQQPGKAIAMNTTDRFVLSNNLFSTSYTRKAGKLRFDGCKAMNLLPSETLFKLRLEDGTELSSAHLELKEVKVLKRSGEANAVRESLADDGYALTAVYSYKDFVITYTIELRDGSHYLRTEMQIDALNDVRFDCITPMTYTYNNKKVKNAPVVVGNTRGALLANNYIFAGLETPMGLNTNRVDSTELATIDSRKIVAVEGDWVRRATLHKGEIWHVSAVVGLIAPGQARRSFLAYSERERAASWHPMTIYNSWYELNIDRNNAPGNRGVYDPADVQNLKGDYTENMTATQCTDVVQHWKDKFYDVYGKAPVAFVFDDGWDAYGTWTFNPNFPNGFHDADSIARTMGAGIGAWLGPVGGYGASGEYRRGYWRERGGMQLSNKAYFDYFVKCSKDMIEKYDFRFFKFDGISAQFSAVGPDLTDAGIENCEAIISIENEVRKKRADIFYNTTVGTWASPFWFHVSDAVWRQEGDFGKAGVGDDREQWITYRDRLVHQNFIERSPLCPINTLMTHGVILTKFGDVSKTMNYDGIVREMRCAFGCGSSMVELYTDYNLLDSIKDNQGNAGTLWRQLADCMDWQQRNTDVLPDIHWVGGNPWDGEKANIYGWAAWNGKKTTLTLRNPDTEKQTLVTTLREVFDIPSYAKSAVVLRSSFADQVIGADGLSGLAMNEAIDIDSEINITMPASSVFVFEGIVK